MGRVLFNLVVVLLNFHTIYMDYQTGLSFITVVAAFLACVGLILVFDAVAALD